MGLLGRRLQRDRDREEVEGAGRAKLREGAGFESWSVLEAEGIFREESVRQQ